MNQQIMLLLLKRRLESIRRSDHDSFDIYGHIHDYAVFLSKLISLKIATHSTQNVTEMDPFGTNDNFALVD